MPTSQFIFLLLLLLIQGQTMAVTEQADEKCMPTRCRNHGPTIRFPFRIKGHQPEHCGYPGFDLSCTDQSKHPVLELPFSVNVSVNKINYTSQTIYVSKPHGCFPRLFPNLSLISPFQFTIDYDYQFHNYRHNYYKEFGFLNCSKSQLPPGERGYYGIQIACLGDKVYARSSFRALQLPCRKMYDMTLTQDILDNRTFGILPLNWTKPTCGNCEAGGKYCRLKNNSREHETECFDKPKLPTKDLIWKLKVAGLVLVLSLFVVAVVAIYLVYRSSKNKERGSSEDYKIFGGLRSSQAVKILLCRY
ncbi:RING-H2 finger protein [Actinidia chinensis var. chinensis]|uniref:RING-type E3 ubiquitin transferase n=1 Tax=Actinidia chinensis var. chinensis TaxID=1590841 RepID=A0A2R6RW55_ACTCC|nr:RING-H2 finger protein [Actinidia chinensis var. chinensis]